MSSLVNPFCLLISLLILPLSQSASDYTSLIYKGCAKQALTDPTGVYSQALSSLFGSLIAKSSNSKFYKTTAGSGQTTINGLFQCRGDLSNVDCYDCVSNLPTLIDKLCGQQIAARVQVLGCYMLYEISGFTQISGLEMLYKTCSGKDKVGAGFEEKRDTVLSQLENGIGGGKGFYMTSYQSVYALGQCEGDLGNADCGDCIRSAVQRVQVECGSSVSGMVFLDKCFVSYNYGSNSLPEGSGSGSSSSSGSGSGSGSGSDSDSGTSSSSVSSTSDSVYSPSGSGHDTGKTVAIILGGAAGVGFLVLCLLVVKNATKKEDDD